MSTFSGEDQVDTQAMCQLLLGEAHGLVLDDNALAKRPRFNGIGAVSKEGCDPEDEG